MSRDGQRNLKRNRKYASRKAMKVSVSPHDEALPADPNKEELEGTVRVIASEAVRPLKNTRSESITRYLSWKRPVVLCAARRSEVQVLHELSVHYLIIT